jgi:NAD(P)-dependent dehydrogenase (short-subunit alcohol dehydrogenase family)
VAGDNPVNWAGWAHPKGTVAIVTGGGSGIGEAAVILAAMQGYKVAAWDINPEGNARTIAKAGPELAKQIVPITVDLGDPAAIQRAMDETVKALGKPKLVVNNAAPVAIGKPPASPTPADFLQMIDMAIGSVQQVTSAFIATEPEEGASVVNIAAVSGPIMGGGFDWYAAAKAGVMGYTRWCATFYGPKYRFNAIAPGGPIHTPRNHKFIDSPDMAERIARNPMKRPGTPEELASGILFLWSPAASYINGILLVIDGGLTLTGG